MKTNFITSIILLFIVSSCIKEDIDVPPIVCDCPPQSQLIGTDSIMTGTYLGVPINGESEKVYSSLQKLGDTLDLKYINIVGNIFTDLSMLQDRIPLYQSIFLDEQKGTDTGVQISFTDKQVSNIFLNSGKNLAQWPSGSNPETAIRKGDDVNILYSKLLKIKQISAYRNKFERISMFTKDMESKYDPILKNSPTWYFAYTFGNKLMDVVHIDFKDGKVIKIKVQHYQRY